MKFSYKFLQSFFKEKLPEPEKLAELLLMHFFEVEEIEKVGSDYAIDIDVLSSRAGDCFSHIGIAREISAITGLKYELPEVKIKEEGGELSENLVVDVKSACSRYTLRGVEDIKISSSPAFIQERLKTCGIKSINNIVDIANYVMMETGQPLHAFDADKIEGNKIVVRYARKREKIVTLDEKRIDLEDNVLVIADEESPIGVAGIKGGVVAEIDKNTKRVYLESANFDAKTIRKGSQSVGIRTDASLRYEHGVPLEFTELAINRAILMMAEVAGGKIMKGVYDYYPEKPQEKEIAFNIENLRDVLGVCISIKEVEKILKSLEFKIKRDEGNFFVEVPYFRTDVLIKEDVFEEVARIYGYEKIEPASPKEEVIPKIENENHYLEMSCKEVLMGLGYSESINYSFVNEERSIFFDKKSLIEMEKPVSLEFKYLRPSLLPNILGNFAENEKNFEEVNIFEIGNIFYKNEDGFQEKKKMAVISSSDFYKVKGDIAFFLKKFLLEEADFVENEEGVFFEKNASAKIIAKGEEVGVFGEVSQKTKNIIKIKNNAVLVDFDFEKILYLYKEVKTYEPIFRFPASLRDVAVFVPGKTTYADVLKKIKNTGGKKLKEVELFDVYTGKEVPQGFKSFAFRLFFQDEKKTLSSKEVNELYQKIITTLDKTEDWKVRQ